MSRVMVCRVPDEDQFILDIALSERNVLSLIAKLRTPGSKLTLIGHDVPQGFVYAPIRVEPDEFHYAFPTREGAGPGPMHPVTEFVVEAVRDALDATGITDPDLAQAR